MKIKNFFQKDLEDVKFHFNKEKVKIFIITLVVSMIVHFQLYALMITGPDTLINSMYHNPNGWEVMLLRFGLVCVQFLKGNVVSPVFATLISSVFLAITVNLVIDIFDIKNKYFKYLLAIIFAVAPNFSATLTFFYCSDAYMLGMLLATLSIYLLRKYKDKKYMILVSSVLLMFSIAMYQTYLSVALVLCIATVILDILNQKDAKEIFRFLLRSIVMIIIGTVLFYITAHIILAIFGFQASSYGGADSIGLKTIFTIPEHIAESYQSFFNYFFTDKMIPNTIWGTNIFYAIIFASAIIASITVISKNKLWRKIAVICFIIILPICFGVIEIIATTTDIHVLMACSMIYIFPIFFSILESMKKGTMANVLKLITIICTVSICWIYIWQDNASYISIKAMQNQTILTAERILTRIEELDGYTEDMPVLPLGGFGGNEYLNRKNTDTEARRIFDRSWGFISDTSTIWWGNLDSWRKVLYEYLGANVKLTNERVSKDIFETDEYKTMKYYPDKDSIKIINGTVVVKLSD